MNYPISICEPDNVVICTQQSEWDLYSKNFQLIHAAGGVVVNTQKQVLMIFRLQKWDFPKGKTEMNENYEQTALREVREETGLRNLAIIQELPSTFHTYLLQGNPILKETHWFLMNAEDNQSLLPQLEEDITCVEWVMPETVCDRLHNSYLSLQLLWQYIIQNLTPKK